MKYYDIIIFDNFSRKIGFGGHYRILRNYSKGVRWGYLVFEPCVINYIQRQKYCDI